MKLQFLLCICMLVLPLKSLAIWESLAQMASQMQGKTCKPEDPTESINCPRNSNTKKNNDQLEQISESLSFSTLAKGRNEVLSCAETELSKTLKSQDDFEKTALDSEVKINLVAELYKKIQKLSQELSRNQKAQKAAKLPIKDVEAKELELHMAESAIASTFASIPFSDLNDIKDIINDQVYELSNGMRPEALVMTEAQSSQFRKKLKQAMQKQSPSLQKDMSDLGLVISSGGVQITRGLKESLAQDKDLVAQEANKNPALENALCRIDQKYGEGAQRRDQALMVGSLALTGAALALPRLAIAGMLGRAVASAASAGQVSTRASLIYRSAVTFLPIGYNISLLGNSIAKGCGSGSGATGKGDSCSNYSVKGLNADNCILEATLAALGLTATVLTSTKAGAKLLQYFRNLRPPKYSTFDLNAPRELSSVARSGKQKLEATLKKASNDKAIELQGRVDNLPPILRNSFYESADELLGAEPSNGIKLSRDLLRISERAKVYETAAEHLKAPISADHPWVRVNATSTEVDNFNATFKPTQTGTSSFDFQDRVYEISNAAVEKMRTWSKTFSENLQTETNGSFKYRLEGNRVVIEDFIPSPSTSASVSPKLRVGAETQYTSKGSLMMDEWDDVSGYGILVQKVPDLPLIDPSKGGYLRFHSHFNKSAYQTVPSQPDYKGAGSMGDILWTPNPSDKSGLGNFIIYSKDKEKIVKIGK